VILCTETTVGPTAGDAAGGMQQGGCVNSIPATSPTLYVASDGESIFSPFGLTVDVSEAIQLDSNWVPDPAYAEAFAPGFWTQAVGTSVWYLPSITPCGGENEPSCELTAKWSYTSL
jgi:hypothetical protein